MARSHHEWYRKGLGPRIDSLDLALKGIQNRNPSADDAARKIAQSLTTSSLAYGFTNIHEAAQAVINATPDQLGAKTSDLIQLLRRIISGLQRDQPLILIVGGDEKFRKELVQILESSGKQALATATGRESYRVVLNRDISMIVMDMFLPDQDGRQYIRALHSRPLTAAIPIIAIDAPIHRAENEADLLKEADIWVTKPVDAQKVADLINANLRRAHEIVRAALRDQLTGLLNRAAFSETFDQAMLTHDPSKEPVCLAIISIDKMDQINSRYQNTDTVDRLLQHVGSVLSLSFRATDIVARWDATHFAVMFPGEDYYGGTCAIEKSMAALTTRPFTASDRTPLPLALSAGLIVLNERSTCQEAMEKALNFLYQAEIEGGNRIRGFDSTPAGIKDKVAVFMEESHTSRIVQQLLLNDHFDVLTFTNVTDANWPDLISHHYQLIVIGEQVGSAKGMVILERLRALPQFNRTPIIVLISSEENAVRALELGANDYLVKPIAPQSFTSHLRRVMAHGVKIRNQENLYNLLVVDDEVSTLVIAGTTLGRMTDFSVRLACGVNDALTRLSDVFPDILIVNCVPKGMELGEFLERARAKNTSGRPLTVLLTGDVHQKDIAARLIPSLGQAVLNKPFTPKSLAQEISTAIKVTPTPRAMTADMSQLNAEIRRLILKSETKGA